ncbi:hypothetical protein OnM2_100019 [Erysiphe neolycopersici]|uniref:Uncharacterized protein n=1 Tax=Erysiphe neolycopersici TaxID=212602 RepID=A0A420H931_9PEZI|nr:hypothetical protein OnM2_100019 [Erysiphe neolycopersici]
MAANFQQQINGSAPMLSQQMAQQQQHASLSNNFTSQIHQFIFNAIQSQQLLLSGWRLNVQLNERLSLIMAIISALRNASQHQTTVANMQKIIEMAIKFERDCLLSTPSKVCDEESLLMAWS